VPKINLSTESLEQLLNTFMTAHETLSSTASNMTSSLTGTDWESPAATEFRAAWSEQYHPNLVKLLDAVEHFNGEIRNQLHRYTANEGI
jgi:uncharacterized protein YukE